MAHPRDMGVHEVEAFLTMLTSPSDAAFLTTLEQIPAIKTGLPTLGTEAS